MAQTHNPDDPESVSRELARPFPSDALFKDDKGMTYVKYHQVIRRLMYATGNRFDIDVIDQRIAPHGKTQKGVEKFLVTATVKLTIPVLQSSRTHVGVQVAMANTEDLFKGAISDGIKKAAQSFGVGIDLAGDDREATLHAMPEPVVDFSGDEQWQLASRSLHARAADVVGRDDAHDVLHIMAEQAGFASLKAVPVKRLVQMREFLGGPKWATYYASEIEPALADIRLSQGVE